MSLIRRNNTYSIYMKYVLMYINIFSYSIFSLQELQCNEAFLTSMKAPSVLSVGLCVMRNLMFLWHSSTGAGRFMAASVTFEIQGRPLTFECYQLLVSHKLSRRNILSLYIYMNMFSK